MSSNVNTTSSQGSVVSAPVQQMPQSKVQAYITRKGLTPMVITEKPLIKGRDGQLHGLNITTPMPVGPNRNNNLPPSAFLLRLMKQLGQQ